MVIDMEPEARKLMIHYFNALVDVPNRGPFEARIAEQAIKLALLYHVFSRIEIEQRSAGTYGVKELDDELPPLGRLAMEAGLGISEWFAKCQDEYLAKKREEDKENVYYRFYQRFSRSFLILRPGSSTPPVSGFRRRRRRKNTSATGRIVGFWSKSRANRVGAPADGNFLGIGSLRLFGGGSLEPERHLEAWRSNF